MLFGRDRNCAVVAATTAEGMIRQFRVAWKYTRTIELRLDWVRSGPERDTLLRWIARHGGGATLIATCRHHSAGGNFNGDVALQMDILARAAGAGCQWCDVELEAAGRLPHLALEFFLKPARVLISSHNFSETPQDLSGVLGQLERCGGEAVKAATLCHSLADSLRVLALARGRRNVIAVPMGEAGKAARVLALRHGSALAYGAVRDWTAPGQLTIEQMKNVFRADQLNRRTRVYGVIGNPVSHSHSPAMHNAAFRVRGLNAVYLPFLVEELRDFLRAIRPLGVAGFSVTLPYKEKILRHLDDCDPLARSIGAVNTVVVRGGGELYGYNTDYVGALRALERRVRLRGSRVLFYGAGGAARAAAFALAQAGAIVCVCARRHARAEALARAVRGEAVRRPRLKKEFFDAVVNCTPAGMHPNKSESPLQAQELNCRVVMDMVYRPARTRLLELAIQRGIQTVSGVEMFLAQGAAQWEIWTGERAPVKEMRRAVRRELHRDRYRRVR